MLKLTVVPSALCLQDHIHAWESLAVNAMEPNPFYEPWFLLPAIDSFGCNQSLIFVLVYAEIRGKASQLCAFFPLVRCYNYRGLPVPHLRLWKHLHCFLCTPLLRRPYAKQCLSLFHDWLADEGRASMMEWGTIAGDGPFYRTLSEALQCTGRASCLTYSYERAMLRPRIDGEAYIGEALSKKTLTDLRRLGKRLGELGELRYTTLEPGTAAEPWIETFLRLEASGWKGRRGSALNCSEEGRSFFTKAALQAAQRGKAMMLALELNGEPIAMKCNFLAQSGGYTFKMAYDERYARYSPGMLLELENIREFHRRESLRWMDSCAEANHPLMNRVWLDRQSIAKVLTATGRPTSRILLSSLPILKRVAMGFRGVFAA
jgi:Acetyltransferase (GNAT) domain